LLRQAQTRLTPAGTLLVHLVDADLPRLPLDGWRVRVLEQVFPWSAIAALNPDRVHPVGERNT
jgi:hypothetical protein